MGTRNFYIKEKTAMGTTMIPIDTDLFSNRTIFIEGEITFEEAVSFLKQITVLITKDKKIPIKVVINSHGGMVDAGLMIYDIIQTTETPIQMYCFGVAYSMAALLFLSGNHGRFLTEHSKLMIHEPLIQSLPGGNATSLSSVSDSLNKTKKQLDEIISKHSGKSLKEIAKSTSYDHYFSAKEAVDYGLADKIITLDDVIQMEEK